MCVHIPDNIPVTILLCLHRPKQGFRSYFDGCNPTGCSSLPFLVRDLPNSRGTIRVFIRLELYESTFPMTEYEFRFPTFSRYLLSVFLIIAILAEVRWYSMVIQICISFMAGGIEHFSCFDKCLFTSFAYFLKGLAAFFFVCLFELLI